jgi:hypothetical protein
MSLKVVRRGGRKRKSPKKNASETSYSVHQGMAKSKITGFHSLDRSKIPGALYLVCS